MSSKNRTMYTTCTEILMFRKKISLEITRGLLNLVRARNPRGLASFCLLFLLAAPFFTPFILQEITPSQIHSTFFSTAAEPPVLILTYYSWTNTTLETLDSGDRISGDHIILNATWLPEENVNGTEIVVNATAIPSVIKATSLNNTVEIDTRLLGNNATCTVKVTTWLLNGTQISEFYTNIFLGNFFAPSIKVLSPNGGEIWTDTHNITWTASDRNIDDILKFEIHLSSDNGDSFQLLSSDISTTWLLWDFSNFQNLSSYVIEIRASDGIYETMDKSDGNFTAGRVNPTSTGTTPTTLTDSIPPPLSEETQTAIFIAAAIIMSAFLSLIVYHQAKKLS